ncbi:hypothetical protein [Niveibacterium sp.]|uniref:hypothetical protein n=1 Tax=Niveibacterium sp. TaxID=2017444 RepID=UPI0035B07B00
MNAEHRDAKKETGRQEPTRGENQMTWADHNTAQSILKWLATAERRPANAADLESATAILSAWAEGRLPGECGAAILSDDTALALDLYEGQLTACVVSFKLERPFSNLRDHKEFHAAIGEAMGACLAAEFATEAAEAAANGTKATNLLDEIGRRFSLAGYFCLENVDLGFVSRVQLGGAA